MTWFNVSYAQWAPIPALFLEIGFVLLGVVLFWYARILGKLLEMLQRPPLDTWVYIAGWILILTFVLPHYYVSAVVYPHYLNPAAAVGNPDILPQLWVCRTISFFGMWVAAILAFVPGFMYYRWTSE
jgi:ABC-type phosphate/phosphonate transport system permease subunit